MPTHRDQYQQLGRSMVHFEQHFTATGNVVVSDVFGAFHVLNDTFHRIGGRSDFREIIARTLTSIGDPAGGPPEISN